MRFDHAGYILGATVTHPNCVPIKYFMKLVGSWEVAK